MAVVAMAATLWLLVPREASPPIGGLASIDEAPSVPVTIGRSAPDFAWVDVQGERQRLADLRGRVVVVNFWATWCAPCREELPALDALARDDGVVVLAVNLHQDPEQALGFLGSLGVRDLRALLDPDGETSRRYGVVVLPVTVFIDSHGTVRHVEHGGPQTLEALRGLVESLRKDT